MLWLYVALLLTVPGSVSASTYTAVECTPNSPSAPDFDFSDPNQQYERSTVCRSSGHQRVQARNRTRGGHYANLSIKAPSGIKIRRASFDYELAAESSFTPVLFEKPTGRAQIEVTRGDRSSRTYNTGFDRFDYVGVGLFCRKASNEFCGNQDGGPYGSAKIGKATIDVVDEVAPTGSLSSVAPLFDGKWHQGSGYSITVSGTDTGAGVAEQSLYVNAKLTRSANHCPSATGANGWTSDMAPCNPGLTRNLSLTGADLAAAPFWQGRNVIRGCTKEFGVGARSDCDEKAILVDTVAPTAPLDLQLVGDSGWRSTNDFDFRWEAPQQVNAPIRGAFVRVTKSDYDSGWTFKTDATEKLDNLKVPSPGEYTVQIALMDAAGNVDLSRTASSVIRFDDVAPQEAVPEIANGWINRLELERGYVQRWAPPKDPIPASGIRGYAARFDQSPSTDPCDVAGLGGQARSCSAQETNIPGIDNRALTIAAGDPVEGDNWFHVLAVSGAGVAASKIGHTRLRVDTGKPEVRLEGAGEAWNDRDRKVAASATDAISGMKLAPGAINDLQPLTRLEIDGAESSEPGASASALVSGDGIHAVRYQARDLAGNTSSWKQATVKVDRSKPEAFMSPLDPNDPDLVSAHVDDKVSGVRDAALEVRENAGPWTALDSDLNGGVVSARVNSERMSADITYTFRVVATDLAGNTTTSSKTRQGEVRTHVGPLRSGTTVSEFRINDKRKATTIGYGRKAQVSGVLLDARGNGVPGARATVVESYDAGAKRDQHEIPTTTNAKGVFSAALPAGPSRTVTARFDGDRALLSTKSAAEPRLEVRGKINLKVTHRKVRPGRTTRFRGRVAKAGAEIPGGGKLVEVQVRVRNQWRTVDKAQRTNRSGRFNLRYRFGRFYTQPVKFIFRAVTLDETAWPYKAPVKSGKTSVKVVPRG